MKLWTQSILWTVSLLILSGCDGITPTPKENVVIDNTLPTIVLTRNGVIVGMNTIAFEYESIKDQRVSGVYVYKKSPSKDVANDFKYLSTIENRFKTHYIDSDVQPDTKYSYMFKTFTSESESNPSQITVVNTLPVLESVSWIHSITGLPRTAKIIWRPHSNKKVNSYVVERKTLEDKEWIKHSIVYNRLNAEYIDEDLEDNYVYMYRVKVVTYDGVVSTPSQFVKVVTKPLPKSIENITTTKNLPREIKVSWSASSQEDFHMYNLYRSGDSNGNYDLIGTLYNNSFADKIDKDGKVYFYRVSVVDKDGLESISEKNSIQGMTLPKPQAPSVLSAELVGSTIEVKWQKTEDRIVGFIVQRKHRKGFFDTKKENYKINTNSFTDTNIVADSTYSYVVYSVDKFGIQSEPSIEVQVVTPESMKIQDLTKQKVKEEAVVVAPKEELQERGIAADDLDLSGL